MSRFRVAQAAPMDLARAFDRHAAGYDRLVAASPGYHEHLRMSAQRMGIRDRGAGLHLLDLGCGTGASTAALLDAAPEARITAVDASGEMLAQAARKVWPERVRFVHGDVTDLAAVGVRGPYDGLLAAYLLRNLPAPNEALRLFHDLLRPGAPLALHEYSVRDSVRSRLRWSMVCWAVIIPMGLVRTGSSDLYRYLWRSVLRFDGVAALTERMSIVGFEDVRVQTFPGWSEHVVHTFLGRRSLDTDSPVAMTISEAPTPPMGTPMVAPRPQPGPVAPDRAPG